MGKDRAVRVEQGYGCYCWARIGQLGLSKDVGLDCYCWARIGYLGLSKVGLLLGKVRAVRIEQM